MPRQKRRGRPEKFNREKNLEQDAVLIKSTCETKTRSKATYFRSRGTLEEVEFHSIKNIPTA